MDPLSAASGCEPTLGESLAVDLIARFGEALDGVAGVHPLAAGLVRRLAGGRPIDAPTRLFAWLSAHGCGGALPATVRAGVVEAWRRSVALWHRAARRLPSSGAAGVDRVGRIADWLERDVGRDGERSTEWIDPPPVHGMPLFGNAAATVVLGHPAADPGASAVWHRRVVCLGAGALHPWRRVDHDPATPTAVLIHPGLAGRLVEWLTLGDVEGKAGWQEEGSPMRGIWLSAVPHAAAGIVDAA